MVGVHCADRLRLGDVEEHACLGMDSGAAGQFSVVVDSFSVRRGRGRRVSQHRSSAGPMVSAARAGIGPRAITTSSLIGGAAAPIAASLLIASIGWRSSFVVFGSLGVIWAVAFYFWFRASTREPSGGKCRRTGADPGRAGRRWRSRAIRPFPGGGSCRSPTCG